MQEMELTGATQLIINLITIWWWTAGLNINFYIHPVT